MCLSMIDTCHLGSSPLFPRGDLRGVSTVESTLARPPCSPPLEKGGRAESLPVQFLHTSPPMEGNAIFMLNGAAQAAWGTPVKIPPINGGVGGCPSGFQCHVHHRTSPCIPFERGIIFIFWWCRPALRRVLQNKCILTLPVAILLMGLSLHWPLLAQQADLILHHGKIVTVDKQFTIQEAIAIKGNRILRVGQNEDVSRLQGKRTKMVDLGGKTVLPGLIDSHVHPSAACMTEFDHPIPEMETIADVLNYVKSRASALKPG